MLSFSNSSSYKQVRLNTEYQGIMATHVNGTDDGRMSDCGWFRSTISFGGIHYTKSRNDPFSQTTNSRNHVQQRSHGGITAIVFANKLPAPNSLSTYRIIKMPGQPPQRSPKHTRERWLVKQHEHRPVR